jgi:DNA-binding CsgD family transcriptional regulator
MSTLNMPKQNRLLEALPNNVEEILFKSGGNAINTGYLPINRQKFPVFDQDKPLFLEYRRRREDEINRAEADSLPFAGNALSDKTEIVQLQKALQQKNAELEQIKAELNEINTALTVLMKHQQSGSLDIREVLEKRINQEIMPFLSQLKKSNKDSKQLVLLRIIETNLQSLIPSCCQDNLSAYDYQKLTPKEIQVASMIRQGLATKSIAATLSTSTETISTHRKNIRKKLGLDNKAANLRNRLVLFDSM